MELEIQSLDRNTLVNLVCLYYAQLQSSDPEYKDFGNVASDLALYSGLSTNTVKNRKQAYDGVYDNGRRGWTDLNSRTLVKQTYDQYKDVSLPELKSIAKSIVDYVRSTFQQPIFSIKTKDSGTVDRILNKEQNVRFDGLNVLRDSIKIGNLVFIVLGGDKPSWQTGLIGLGTVSKEPYSDGGGGKNFSVDVDIRLLLDKPIKREDLIPYGDTYGTIGIAPITKWEPNQALTQVEYRKAIALLRAMLEIDPSIEDQLVALLSEDMIVAIKGYTLKYVPVETGFDGSYDTGETGVPASVIASGLEPSPKYDDSDFLSEVFIDKDALSTLLHLLEVKKNLILQGSPGVGKSYMATRLAYCFLGKKKKSNVRFVQFHQSYSYEDFVMGYRPSETGFHKENGPFYDFCVEAAKSTEPFFFIIDEINRANLSRVFGELLMLIEPSHRNEKIHLAYDKENLFSIPDNVYIIGTMNTADRSLAIIDYALRRRFAFYKVRPAFENNRFKELFVKSDLTKKIINEVIQLNEDIKQDESLKEGFCIGHSYFCTEKNSTKEDLRTIVDYEILPLLEEYWYDEQSKVDKWEEKLHSVLNQE